MDSRRRTQTRKITAKEAKACASEEVQYIGTVQPHGFVLVADATTYEVVQHSENVIQRLNGVLQKPLAADAKILGTNLSDWLTLPQDFFSHINDLAPKKRTPY